MGIEWMEVEKLRQPRENLPINSFAPSGTAPSMASLSGLCKH